MAELHKLTKNGQTIYPATTTDAVVHPEIQAPLTDLINEYNVSVLYPTGGLDNTDKYNLATAVAKLDSMLNSSQKTIGTKLAFMSNDGTLEEYTYVGNSFDNTSSWSRFDVNKFNELDLKTLSLIQPPADGNLFDATQSYAIGKYVSNTGSFNDNTEYNIYAIPMNRNNIYVNFDTAAHLAACDKYGNVTHVNADNIYTDKTLIYQEGDIYALVSVRNTEENPIISYQEITVSELPAGYLSNSTFDKFKEELKNFTLQGSCTDGELDSLITPGIYQRVMSLGAWRNILYFVQKGNDTSFDQMRIYINSDGKIEISSRKTIDSGISWSDWVDYSDSINKSLDNIINTFTNNFNSYQNLFDISKATTGVFLNSSNKFLVNEIYAVSDYILFTKGMKYLSSWVNGVANNSGSAYVFLYDKDKNVINSYSLDICKGVATWEEGVSFVRFSIRNYQDGKVQVIIGKNKLPYRSYNNTLKTSLLGLEKSSIIEGTINSQQTLSLPLSYIRKNNYISAEIEGDNITNFKIGYGLSKQYQGWWIEVTTTEIKVYQNVTSETLKNTFEHGLTFGNKVFVTIVSNDTTAKVILTSNGKAFVQEINEWFGGGETAIFNGGNTSLAVKLSNFPRDAKKDIWLYGDSYFSYWQTDRWTHYMLEWGFNNFQLSHLPGINGTNMFDVLLNELSFGNPKYIVWCLGMNDGGDSDANTPNSTWLDIISRLIEICAYKGIELILATIPSVPNKSHEGKNKWVRESGYRYIDFAKAVGATAEGLWDNDYLSSDEVHPTETGAIALASRAMVDFPEIVE